jgi:hypothetical protein
MLTREQIEQIKTDIREGRPIGITRSIALCDAALQAEAMREAIGRAVSDSATMLRIAERLRADLEQALNERKET